MAEKQLNVWIPEELREYIAQRAEQEGRGMKSIIVELIQQDMARQQGEAMEQGALVVLREMMASEIRQATAQLRRDLRQDREYEAETQQEWVHKQLDRLAGLMVLAVRNSSLVRRLTYTLLSKAHGKEFAEHSYNLARKKVEEELTLKRPRAGLPASEEDADVS